MEQTAAALLPERWLPGRRLVIARTATGGSTPVYQVDDRRRGERWYLRLAEQAGDDHAAEAAVHQRLRAAGLPVPAVVQWEARPAELDRGAMLTTAISGVPLAALRGCQTGDWQAAQLVAGATLPVIGAVPVRGFGWVTGVSPEGDLIAAHVTRNAWVAEYAEALATVRSAALVPFPAAATVVGWVEHWIARPDAAVSSLAHGDWDDTHLFVDPFQKALIGLIDFGEIRGADLDYDLAHALFWGGGRNRPFAWEVIAAGAGLKGDPVRRQRVVEQAAAIGVRQLAIGFRTHRSGWPDIVRRLVALVERAPAIGVAG